VKLTDPQDIAEAEHDRLHDRECDLSTKYDWIQHRRRRAPPRVDLRPPPKVR